jgi:hypothetical protein
VDAGTEDAGPADAGAPLDGGSCLPSTIYGSNPGSLSNLSVTAKIVDETGSPVPSQPAWICGINICSAPGMTDGSGHVMITAALTEEAAAFKVGDEITYAALAIPLTTATTDFTEGGTAVLNTAKLADSSGATLTPGTSVTSGAVTVSLAADATVAIDELTYGTPAEQEFHAVSIPLANDGPWLASSGHDDFALLYGISPAETPICPAAQISVTLPHATLTPNDFGWTPGTQVEFWITTIDTGQTYAPYGGWAKASDGTVSSDGTKVVTTQGLLALENFAIRKAQ